ncbi:hypothetical protein BH09ACT12_BH09ACT12_20250 [soil metagenome]
MLAGLAFAPAPSGAQDADPDTAAASKAAPMAAPMAAPSRATGSDATSKKKRRKNKLSSLTVRLTPSVVTVFANGATEPTGVLAQVTPAVSKRLVTIQRKDAEGVWRTVRKTTTNRHGQVYFAGVDVTTLGTQFFRGKVKTSRGYRKVGWKSANLYTRPNDGGCDPVTPLVDTQARGEAVCLAARLDRWSHSRLMGVGQQVNISSQTNWADPLDGIKPAIIGFDLQELDYAASVEYPYAADNISGLIERAHEGAILVAVWHATDPFTGGTSHSPRHKLEPLLDPSTDAYAKFWADWDRKLDLLKRFQDDDADGDPSTLSGHDSCWCTALVVRPLHEANGGFFWWGQAKPATYRKLYAELQRRAAEKDVHNIVWAFAGNRNTSTTSNPGTYVPPNVDLGGLDTYDPEGPQDDPRDYLNLEGYDAIASKVPRMALTESGPHGSKDGNWNPAVITRTVRAERIRPLWSMLWYDDSGYAEAGPKQITSVKGGMNWLRSCPNSLCSTRP